MALFALLRLVPVLLVVACGCSAHGAGDELPLGVPGTLPLEEIRSLATSATRHTVFVPAPPLGIVADLARRIPADNPLTPAKVELGAQLFFDARLSRDGSVACASCHHPSTGWAGPIRRKGKRDAPTIANRVLGSTQFSDGRAATLEEQVLVALANPLEMASSPEEVCARVDAIEGYRLQFGAVFGGAPTPERVAKAIAAFERTILSGASPIDAFEQALPFRGSEPVPDDDLEFHERRRLALETAERHPMSAAAQRGRALFSGMARCSSCHAGQDFSDELFHNLGVGMGAKRADLGRHEVTKAEADRGAFRTPSLRNVAWTAPYMHDGSLATLREVVEHHERGGAPNPWLSERIKPLGLSAEERADLVAFLEEGLTGDAPPLTVPRLP